MEILASLIVFDFEAFTKIVLIELVMSGDNAIIIGVDAAGLPLGLRRATSSRGLVS